MAMAASSPQSTTAAAAKSGLNDPEAIIARLNDPKADRKIKIAVASEIKDQSETVYNNGDYPRFLKAIVPAYTSLLSNTPCAFTSESPEHKLRHILLETLHRLYPSEAARPFASSLMTCMLEVVRSDNEENAVQALKIIIDLHRTHKAVLEEHVQPFLNLVQTLYTNMKDTVKEAFGEAKEGGTTGQSSDSPMAAPSPAGESAAGSEGPLAATASSSGPRTLVKSLNSFKVLTECPIAVVLIFQSYRAVVPAALQLFVPLIVQQCLLLEAAPQAEAHSQAAAKGEIFVGVAPSIAAKNRSVFTDMVVAQVKSMSFLAYVIRGSASVMRPHANVLPVVSVRLLKDCPPESAGTRKELLVAIRHLLGTDFRATFVSQLDALLDERVNILVGTGVTSYETHRPLAISMLADLVHHVRNELNPTQLERVVAMHTQILHDSTIAPSIQTMCVKLLLNLVDTICNKFPVPTEKDQTDQAAVLLRTMMNAFVEKTGSLARLREDIENARAQHRWEREEKAKEKEASSSSSSSAITTTSTSTSSSNGVITSASPSTETPVEEKREIMAIDSVAIERAKPIQAAAVLQDPVSDLLKDARFLFRNVLLGFKSLLSHLKSRNAIQPDGELMGRLFVNVVKCWSLHDGRDTREEKDILDNFTNLLTDAPPQIFHEVFTRHLPFLFEATKQNHSLLGIAQNLLSNDATSSRFVAILLRFLVANDHLSKLGEPDKKHVNVSLRLFKMSFMAVTIFPEENEVVLQPHLSHLIMTSIRFAAAAQEPTNYFLLLRALFRSIGGGKFELLYEDVLPLLPVLLENLNALLASAEGAMEASVSGASSSTAARRELFVDLCLTVPVRLNVLLPYLGYLMRPLVLALQSRSSPELVSQGLRTLELCIDNLTQEFLDPIMAPYSNDIMAALWSHLAPLPHNHQHSHTTMRILGKMGGRNRRGLQDPPKLAYTQQPPNNKEQVWTMSLEGKLQNMPLAPIIEVALANVKRTDVYYRRHAFQLLSSAAAILLETVVSSSTLSNSSNPNFLGTAVAPNSDAERTGQLELVIRGLFEATRGEDLQEEATTFLLNFARHAFEFELGREMPLPAGTSPRHLTFLTTALFDGIAQTLAQADSADLSSFVEIERAIILDLKDACDGNASPVPKMPDSSSGKDGEKTSTSEEKKENQVEGKEKGKGKASSSSKSTKSGQPQSTSTSSSTLPNGSSSSSSTSSPATRPDIFQTLMHSLMSKHCTHCYSSHWARKTGGWAGVDMLLRRTNASKSWIREHQLEAVRALLFMLKDMPSDPPGNVKEVSDTLLFFLQEANARSEKDEQLDLEVEKEKQEAKEKEENEKKNGENTEDSEKEKEKDVKKEKNGEKGKEESKDKDKEKNGSEAEKPSDNSGAVKKPSLPPPGSAAEQKLVQDRQFQYLTGILVPELSASNSHVREVTRKAFELLAVQRGVSVTDILLQVKDRLLVPIFQKPLRALPFGMQIGYIDAITYALQLRPPLPDFNEELARVLTEALALVNAEDNTLVGRAQHTQYKNMLSVTKIRVVAIRLLASAMACPAFSKMPMPPDTSMKMNIISVYFKSLYSRSDEIVQVAYASLKDTLQGQAKLPKDVLQSGLRPILMTLADSGRLTPHGLGGLANLLELLTSYFKVEIGQKLLSHMTAIAEAEALRVASKGALTGPSYSDAHHLLRPVPVRESDCVETLAAVTRVFHLLPPAAVNFMNDLVQRVLLIEDQLHRSGPTPFTKPLAQFFNKFPAESTTYLFGKLEDPRYVRCLRLTLAEEAAPNFREYISQNKETVLLPLFGEEAEPKKALAGLFVIKVLIEIDSNWVSENKDVFEALIAHWASPACEKRRLESADTCAGEGSRENNEIVQLTDVFCSFLAHEPNVDAYFQLVDVFTYRIAIDRNPLVRFVDQHLALGAPVSFCRQILERFMQVFENKEIDQAYKIQALRVLVNPMIFTSFQSKVRKIKRQTTVKPEAGDSDGDIPMQDGTKTIQSKEAEEVKEKKAEDQEEEVEEDLFDAALITQIVNRIWKPFQSKAHILAAICSDDSLRIELLHMSSMILEHCSQLLSPAGPARKDTIKFGWANLTAEDVTVKNAAYIFIARFLDAFESPIKIVGQVYLGLLRTHQPEGRAMVRKALDILVPVLPRRTGPVEPGQPPLWARWTKRQLIDEGHNTSQLFAILSVIVRHPDLFYPVRDMFLPQIAASLTKLSLIPTSTSAESRYLTIELIDMIASWEKRRQKAIKAEAESANSSSNADPDSTVETGSSRKRAEEETEEPRSTRKRARIDTAGTSSTSTPSTTTATASTQPAAATSASAAANGGEHSYVLPPNLCESVVGALVRFVSLSADPISRGGVVGKAFGLLEELTSEPFWPDVEIKLDSLRRPLAVQELNDANVNILCNALQVLQSSIKGKDDQWILDHLAQLRKLLERSLLADSPPVLDAVKPILERIFLALPDTEDADADGDGDADGDADEEMATTESGSKETKATKTANGEQSNDEASEFLKSSDSLINEGLSSQTRLYATFVTLDAWAQKKPEKIDQFLIPLTKALTKLTKEHLSAQAPVSSNDQGLKLLIKVLDLLKLRISNLGDQRRWFLSALVQLVERSTSLDLCRFLLSTMSKWILGRKEMFPTVKEKAGILVKMMSYESRDNDQLLRDYLDLIHSIYTTPAFARTELTVRLENAFLLGCRHRDPHVRQRFIDIFDRTLVNSLSGRLQYLLGTQSWEYLADHYWIQQSLDLLLGSAEGDRPVLNSHSPAFATRFSTSFTQKLRSLSSSGIVSALRALLYTDKESAHKLWVLFFKAAWRVIPRKSQEDVSRTLIALLTREYNLRQVGQRPNVAQTLLQGALACTPQPELPPHVVKYIGKSFNAWYTAAEVLQNLLRALPREDDAIREAGQDALAELYAELSEDDLFYGLWRRRCVYAETNTAISYEQNGMWAQAQIMYEGAQIKARTGVLSFTEAEYSLWEDHWVICAQNLQQWDILTDLAKLEGDTDLLLECAWRLSDWTNEREVLEQALESVSATSTPRRRVFEAYMALLKSQSGLDRPAEFGRICDEAIQLTLRKWHSLPTTVTQAHVPLLQIFQQFVELQEASTVFASLANTTAQNLDQRSTDLKTLMLTWRERLPNKWDDINSWSDLVAWRQHVFGAVNKAYLPLVPMIASNGANGSSTNSYAYRGYHETAWIINRFAHVARKHYLNDVCISSLTKIYTLPNIEIQEAFLKLREQAKCHYQNQNELAQGLEVINNTNLMFFAAPQKAEFFTLKGMFMAKLGLLEEANHSFATAIQMDLTLAKAWCEWGRYHDRNFRDFCQRHNQNQNQDPTQAASAAANAQSMAANAVHSYLQAASLYKSSKTRKVLIRILWLLSCDDSQGKVAKAFEDYRGETPIWYWITFIPQLLQSLSFKEARYARMLLMQIAKTYPQSLYYHLRTAKEDLMASKRQAMMIAQRARQLQSQQGAAGSPAASGTPDPSTNGAANAASPEAQSNSNDATDSPKPQQPQQPRQAWEHVDEILNILKTAFPLLALTMESVAEQIQQRFKPSTEEDIYRLTNALLNDALLQYIQRATVKKDDGALPESCRANVSRFAENIPIGSLKTSFEEDFIKTKPNLREYVQRLQRWRDRYESILDRRASRQHLEHCSHYLVEFQHQKFDEVEVPGQYLRFEDNNSDFVKIARFLPIFDLIRSSGMCSRRITILSNKGSKHMFTVQLPSARHCRREEKLFQLLRLLNRVLERRKETRKRGLVFHTPTAVPLAPTVRLIDYDSSFVSLQDIYERHCEEIGIGKDDPLIAWVEKMRSTWDHSDKYNEYANLRMELLDEISTKMVPETVLSKYMTRCMATPSDLWLMRKHFTLQWASNMFLTYVLFVSSRLPNRIHISRSSGQVTMSDLVPTLNPQLPQFKSTDATPFRLSINIQNFIGPIGIEGVLTSSLMAIGRCLSEPEYDLEEYLSIFVRDEINFWYVGAQRQAPGAPQEAPKEIVMSNAREMVKRARILSCKHELDKMQPGSTPVSQTVLDLINTASNPVKLSQQDPTWAPWL